MFSYITWIQNTAFLLLTLSMLSGCTSLLGNNTRLLGKNERYAIVTAGPRDTFASLAKHFFGDETKSWIIEDANNSAQISSGQWVVIPLAPLNRVGIFSDGYQTVPILTYHRFGEKQSKLSISVETFEKQMAYLRDNGYHVIPLKQLLAFLAGETQLPRRTVVITIDDGYRSVYSIAYPILKKYRFPATLFVYSDFIGSSSGLTWQQMKEMIASGLISVQAHSKSHSNLALPENQENELAYRQRIMREIEHPTRYLARHLQQPLDGFAYPYGDANIQVLEALKKHNYSLGFTVQRGGNPSFAYPLLLRRTLIFGSDSMKKFEQALATYRKIKPR